MAKKSMIHRDVKRSKLVEKFKERRLELKKIIKSIHTSDEDRFQAVINYNHSQETLHLYVNVTDVVFQVVLMGFIVNLAWPNPNSESAL